MSKVSTFTRSRVIDAIKPVYSQIVVTERFIEKHERNVEEVSKKESNVNFRLDALTSLHEKKQMLEWFCQAFGIEEMELASKQ